MSIKIAKPKGFAILMQSPKATTWRPEDAIAIAQRLLKRSYMAPVGCHGIRVANAVPAARALDASGILNIQHMYRGYLRYPLYICYILTSYNNIDLSIYIYCTYIYRLNPINTSFNLQLAEATVAPWFASSSTHRRSRVRSHTPPI